MRPFEYTSPTTYDQAGALLDKTWGHTAILAGGTDLLSLMKDDVEQPRRLVNIKQMQEPGTDNWQPKPGVKPSHLIVRHGAGGPGVLIDALCTIQEVADNAIVRKELPALAEACDRAASPQIRNMATIAGNLCQRPRCWYFRNGFGLLAMKDGKSLVTEGDNRYHAILQNDGPAKFVSPSSIAPVLIAYGASVWIWRAGGPRRPTVEEFFRIPRAEGEREHDLQPDELIYKIKVPMNTSVNASSYEIRQKDAFDWPLASAAVALTMTGATVKSARVVLGHVAPVPWISPEAGQALVGKPVNEQTANAAAQAALAKATPLSRNAYKVQLARVAVKRAILQAAKGGQA